MPLPTHEFDVGILLRSPGRKTIEYKTGSVIFSQGEAGESLFYVEKGSVKLIMTSALGREAVIGIVDGGSFLGEACISRDAPVRMHSAIAVTNTRALKIQRASMLEILRNDSRISFAFSAYMAERCEDVYEALASSLVQSSDKRLARALLMLADLPRESGLRILPGISQQTLANMIGSTRQRVNVLLQRIKQAGFVDGPEGQKIPLTLRNRFPKQ